MSVMQPCQSFTEAATRNDDASLSGETCSATWRSQNEVVNLSIELLPVERVPCRMNELLFRKETVVGTLL